ncbi:glycosyltransferase family 2 protein [Streptomyces sp. BE230]|uniref:glycosyltransferase family 2 protein n=1 Tax=Streptomyces sp. BE230 TaxID=3002526 RepID=UPI002ECFC1D3|nr:glycosyltransferase family 2 protein [Streptomyces sp. BE230]
MPTKPPQVHLACVIGGNDVSLFHHFVDHYRALGVESFLFIRHAATTEDPGYTLIAEAAAEAGIKLFHTHVGPWTLELNQRLIRYAMDEYPDDWYVLADSDEFHVYDRPLPELIEACERGGYGHATGCFLDRIGAGGKFPEVGEGPLPKTFPLAGSVSAGLLRALPLKIAVARGRVELTSGQHGTADGPSLPRRESFVQVHHFKWTASALARLRDRADQLADPAYIQRHTSIVRETRRFLAHVDLHGGRINIGDRRFRVQPCGLAYQDYPSWREVADEAEGWRWAQI